MTFEQLVSSRRSIRRFKEEPVDGELLRKSLELALWAPSGSNRQPYEFIVLRDRDLIAAVADAHRAAVLELAPTLTASSDPTEEAIRAYAERSTWFRRTPVLVAMTVGPYATLVDQLLERGQNERVQAARAFAATAQQSAAAAIQNFLLALHHHGLGGCWLTGPTVAAEAIERLAEAKPGHRLIALIAVGVPAESPAAPQRKAFEEIVRWQ